MLLAEFIVCCLHLWSLSYVLVVMDALFLSAGAWRPLPQNKMLIKVSHSYPYVLLSL
jgi:hypothetical protein